MLLSVAVWSGHYGSMGEATRTLFHWLSAVIALPAIAYAGRPFFRSAFSALKGGRTNMDVPISLGVTLAALMSLHETINRHEHAYFDAAIMLLTFLLAGRFLDQKMRQKTRAVAGNLAAEIEAGQASDAQPHDDHFAQRVEAGALEIVAQPRADAVAEKTFELTQFLVDVCGVTGVAARFAGRAARLDGFLTRLGDALGQKRAIAQFFQAANGLAQ